MVSSTARISGCDPGDDGSIPSPPSYVTTACEGVVIARQVRSDTEISDDKFTKNLSKNGLHPGSTVL